MSDAGEKTCPLCAEEMDLTDQQLKPCKCGYEICIWCWHHIIDMAEKDEAEGRCPACRAPYNKEKVVGTAAKCERLVAEISMERKQKSQKAKNKTSEGRKQLSSVRVIQRNLVYIVGLPLILADEDVLQRKEYFGQYGKVLKASISRTASGAIQQFSNNTCSVYITYSKEEEAIRCMQYVHGFVLDGRSLRACFGTTKYCHAWLRNMPCSNPDCLYLHEIGSQEDSFTKDEIVSAYTRVQQITGAGNNMQRRSGNVLPPPADDCCINSSGSGKPQSKSVVNNTTGNATGSPPNSSTGGSIALPAAASWGTCASNSQPLCESFACSNGPPKKKPDRCGGSMAYSSAAVSSTQASLLQADVQKKLIIPNEASCTIEHKDRLESPESAKQCNGIVCEATASEIAPVIPGVSATSTTNSQLGLQPASKDKDANMPPKVTSSFDLPGQVCGPGPEKEQNVTVSGEIQSLCSNMSSVSIDRHSGNEHSGGTISNTSLSGRSLIKSPRSHGLQSDQFRVSSSLVAGKATTSTDDFCVAREQYGSQSNLPMQATVRHQVEDEDVLSFDYQRHKDPEVVSCTSFVPIFSRSSDHPDHTRVFPAQHTEAYGSNTISASPQVVDNNVDKVLLQHASGVSVSRNGYTQSLVSKSTDSDRVFEDSYLRTEEGKRQHMARFEGETANVSHNAAADMGENNIISNILAMDFDSWDESLTSPQNFSRLLGRTDSQQGCINSSSSRKVQNNQSRFSFARQEESQSQDYGYEPHFSNSGQIPRSRPLSHDIVERRDSYFDKHGPYNGFSPLNVEEFDNISGSNSQVSNKFPGSRAQISAPPGFSVPNRAPPPPGFTSQESVEQAFDNLSGNHVLGNSSFLRNSYQAPPNGNMSSMGDLEFMDPAILAVGKGRLPVGLNQGLLDTKSNFHPQSSAFEEEARLQLLMQRSFSQNQNLRYAEMRDSFFPLTDAYGIPARNLGIMEQSAASNLSPFSQLSSQQSRSALMSNGRWDGWNEVQSGNDMAMAELLRTERLGLNKFYSGYEDSKFLMPSSGNLYNRTFGI